MKTYIEPSKKTKHITQSTWTRSTLNLTFKKTTQKRCRSLIEQETRKVRENDPAHPSIKNLLTIYSM